MMHKKNNNGGGKMRGGHRRYQHRDRDRGNRNQNDHQNMARQKHHAMQMREKYANHAKDAQMNGDVVDMEYYLQHVDHYVRVLADIAAIEAERFQQREQNNFTQNEANDDAGDDDANNGNAPQNNDANAAPRDGATDAPATDARPRRQYRPVRVIAPVESSEGSNDIPLPASVIPAIHT